MNRQTRRLERRARRFGRRAARWQLRERRRQYVRAFLNAYPFGWVVLDGALGLLGAAVGALLFVYTDVLLALAWLVLDVVGTVALHRWLSKPPLRTLP